MVLMQLLFIVVCWITTQSLFCSSLLHKLSPSPVSSPLPLPQKSDESSTKKDGQLVDRIEKQKHVQGILAAGSEIWHLSKLRVPNQLSRYQSRYVVSQVNAGPQVYESSRNQSVTSGWSNDAFPF